MIISIKLPTVYWDGIPVYTDCMIQSQDMSSVSVGIVGLPNVGKSTLFNALLKKQQALAANYPFATIEPNIGVVPVPDERLEKLAEIVAQELNPSTSLRVSLPPIVPAVVQFVDIAGLVKGASEGAGLGNKFLSHIRQVRIIAHVVRAFDPSTHSINSGQAGPGQEIDIVKVGTNPKEDYETITTELILADLQSIEKSKSKNQKVKVQVKGQNELIERLEKALNDGNPVRSLKLGNEEQQILNQLFLLSAKPEIIVLNVNEQDYTKDRIRELALQYSSKLEYGSKNMVVICAKIEEELSVLSNKEQEEYLRGLGLEESGLERLIEKAYQELGLISFLTAGEKEVRAWTIRQGTNALPAAGEIHTDFIRNFIKAEVVSYDDFVSNGGWKGSREAGKTDLCGKDYIVKDGDIIEFKIGR